MTGALSRRAVLTGTTSTAVATIAVAAAAIPARAEQHDDAALIALWRKLQRLEAEGDRVHVRTQALERQYP